MKRLGHSVISNSLNTYWLAVKGFRLFVIFPAIASFSYMHAGDY